MHALVIQLEIKYDLGQICDFYTDVDQGDLLESKQAVGPTRWVQGFITV